MHRNQHARATPFCLLWTVASIVALATWHGSLRAAPPSVPNFSFVQISDIHVSPRPAGMKSPEATRGDDTLAWFCAEASKPQAQTPYNVVAPTPAFAIATGDLTEFGVISETWSDFERMLAPLPCPLYVVPGNHDNTWTAILPIMRARHGGDNYSFDKFGCHFVGLDSASPQEPLPCLDRRTLTWLASDLKKVKSGTPVFVFLHHPLVGKGEFAYPYEQLRLLDVLEGSNVVLILDGHGHNAQHGLWENIDRVMGGSTFGEKAGYNTISVVNGVLRVAYRLHGDKPMVGLLEKPLTTTVLKRPLTLTVPPTIAPDINTSLNVSVRVTSAEPPKKVTVAIDDDEKPKELKPAGGEYRGQLDVSKLTAGQHFVLATATLDDKKVYSRAVTFEVLPGDASIAARRHQHNAGFKAAPLAHKGMIIAADTAGVVTAFDPAFHVKWFVKTGGEVLATPVAAGDQILFGSGDGWLYSVSASTGKQRWRYQAKTAVYSRPAVKNAIAYFGDNEGFVHAVRLGDGKPAWCVKPASFSIESGGIVCGDTFCVGAWDGYVYGLSIKDGTLQWKQPCPTGQAKPNRYYAAADCPPIALGGKLLFADRGYRLGLYGADGTFDRILREECPGIGLSEDGAFAYGRTRLNRLVKFDRDCKVVWEKEVALGRFPIPPTEHAGKVYACSNQGLLSVVDAAGGKILWQYQATPQLHVMAGVAVDDDGTAYVADMDGGLTAVKAKDAKQTR